MMMPTAMMMMMMYSVYSSFTAADFCFIFTAVMSDFVRQQCDFRFGLFFSFSFSFPVFLVLVSF